MKIQHLSENSGLSHYNTGKGELVIRRFLNRDPNERYSFRDAKGIPTSVNGDLSASDIGLISMDGCPKFVDGFLDVSLNHLTNFEHFPLMIGGNIYAQDNEISEFKGHHMIEVRGGVYLGNNKLTSLKNIQKVFKTTSAFDFSDNPITKSVLGILLVEGCADWIFDVRGVQEIVQKYLHAKSKRTMDDVLDCQEELIAAGYDEYAKL